MLLHYMVAVLMGVEVSAQIGGRFSVEDRWKTSVDIVTAISLPLPNGISFASGYKGFPSFYVDGSGDLQASAVEYFPSQFPSQFAISGTIKPKRKESGYLFAVTDSAAKVTKLGLKIGPVPADESRMSITLYWTKASPIYFSVPAFVDQWTKFALQVSEGKVTLYFNCRKIADKPKWTESGPLGLLKTDILHIAGIKSTTVEKYQGVLQELYVSTDSATAAGYCDEEEVELLDIEGSGEESGDGSKEGIVPLDEDEDQDQNVDNDEDEREEGILSTVGETLIVPTISHIGPKGEPGAKGDQGLDGVKGATGQQGRDGLDGKPGPKGADGDKGEPGERGLEARGQKGDPGSQGQKGEPGDSAPPLIGIPGSVGQKGEPGEDGTDGADGIDGEDGEDGAKGARGEPGRSIPGPPGPPGVASPFDEEGSSFEGIQGPPGPQGLKGEPGLGKQGEKGEKGNSGLHGIDGKNGSDGKNGKDGIDGKMGDPGIAGPPGKTGGKGEPGLNGLTGLPGPPGPSGVCRSSTNSFPSDDDNLDEASGDEIIPVAQVTECAQGPAGPVGAPGFTGPQGPPGPQGASGLNGAQGEIGMPGRTGSKGERGLTGPQGVDGPPGKLGLQGQNGEDGIDGRAGPVGPRGLQGEPGPMGPPGPPGVTTFPSDVQEASKGQKGEPGAIIGPDGSILANQKGEPGLSGARGPNGLPGISGSKGDMGMPGRRGSPGSRGLTGLRGPRGFPGEPGINGLPGVDGKPGPPGPTVPGSSLFASGQKGDRGMPGRPGPAGRTGLPGVQGNPGHKGEPGDNRDEDSSTRKFASIQHMQDNYRTELLGTFAFVKDLEELYVKTSQGWSKLILSKPIRPSGKEKKPIKTTQSSTTTTASTTTTRRTTTTSEEPTPEPSLLLSPSSKKLHLIALNSPLNGGMRGIVGADGKCYLQARRAGLPGTYRAFLSSRDQDIRSIVRTQDRTNVPIVNAEGEILFRNWNEIFNGNRADIDSSKILSFERRQVTSDAKWPDKILWHGSYPDGTLNEMHHCVSWYTHNKAVTGQASLLSEGNLLGQHPYGCRNNFIVLCIESNTRSLRYKKK